MQDYMQPADRIFVADLAAVHCPTHNLNNAIAVSDNVMVMQIMLAPLLHLTC